MKKSRSKFLKIVDEKHDMNFHWPNTPTYTAQVSQIVETASVHVC
jgi:hypothetical protein